MEKNKIEKVYDQIHTPEDLKKETLEKMKKSSSSSTNSKLTYRYILSIAALFIFTFAIGTVYKSNNFLNNQEPNYELAKKELVEIDTETSDLKHFKDVEELKTFLKKQYKDEYQFRYSRKEIAGLLTNDVEEIAEDASAIADTAGSTNSEGNFYKTNNQVENVEEADIVKTDGKYIYYSTNENVYIVKAEDLKLEATVDFSLDENTNFYPSEIFITKNKLVVLGEFTEYTRLSDEDTEIQPRSISRSIGKDLAKAYIFDISDKQNPKLIRQVGIDGNYYTSRLIDNTLYLISSKYLYYYPEIEEKELLPIYYDSINSGDEYRNIDCNHIIYCEEAKAETYRNIGAINIEDNEKEIAVETFLGYGNTVYCSENNLYITTSNYNTGNDTALESTEIYKFNISNGGLKYSCKNSIEGILNNQFSLDEYKGNLRVATTVTVKEKAIKNSVDKDFEIRFGTTTTNNVLYILDENLEKISELTNFGIEEKIYSVRFIKDVAYIVTFEQIDPLYIIDLSNPEKPVIKGELEMPGYSSYLHPYDENHIIGIGYNVEDNGHGGVYNSTLKIAMYDVSDLNNPKELFKKSFGNEYSYSDVTYNHKILMYDKTRDLIGFPISIRNEKGRMENSIVLLKIDLENKEFKLHSKYTNGDFYNYIRKVIYIEDEIFILCNNEILSFDINTLDNIADLSLPERARSYIIEDMYYDFNDAIVESDTQETLSADTRTAEIMSSETENE